MRFGGTHLREDVLVQLALGEAKSPDGQKSREHLADCRACRARLHGVRELRSRCLNALVEAPREDSLQRVLSRRAAGERLILADGDVLPSEPSRRHRATVYAAVAAGLVLATFAWRNRESVAGAAANPAVTGRLGEPNPTWAVSPPSAWLTLAHTGDAPRAYGAAQLSRVDQLRAGTRQYVRTVLGSGAEFLPVGAFSVGVSDAAFEGAAAWRVVTRSLPVERSVLNDTAWLRRQDLALMFRRVHGRDGSEILEQRVRGDTLLEQQTTVPNWPQGSVGADAVAGLREIPIRLDRQYPLVTDQGAFMLLLRALPLHRTWRGTIDVNGRGRSPLLTAAPRHVNLRVDGDSTVRTMWGDVSCWRVLLENGSEPERWFVDKQTGDAVFVLQPANADRPRMRLDLLSHSPPVLPAVRVSAP